MTDPTVSELVEKVTRTESTPPKYANSENRAEAERIELEGRRQFFALRRDWSFWLILWICVLLVFQMLLAVFVGAGWLDFREYQWFLPLVTFQNFMQIVGMGAIIVRFLYPPTKDEIAARQ